MTNAQQTTSFYFETPNEYRPGAQQLAEQDARECAELNPGATVRWESYSSFYWHGAYIVTVPA